MVVRRSLIAVLATILATSLALVATSGGSAVAQSDDDGATEASDDIAAPLVALGLGEALTFGNLEIVVDDVLVEPSPTAAAVTEVRLGVTVRNAGTTPVLFRDTAFSDHPEFPRLVLFDADGFAHRYVLTNTPHSAMPGSTLLTIPPGLTARWTVGFAISTAAAENLILVASFDRDGVLAAGAWTLESDPAPATWAPPGGVPTVGLNTAFPWGDMTVAATEFGILLCGDPDVQYATHVLAVGFGIQNATSFSALWPGVSYPASAAYAHWADGASARVSTETFIGARDSLVKHSADNVIVPPSSLEDVHERALLFAAPRDGRLVDAAAAPQGVLLNRPDGTSLWLELEGEPTLPMNPALCDNGVFPFPIPYAFSGSTRYDVGATVAIDDATPQEQDAAADKLLTQAQIVAGTVFAETGDFTVVTEADLEALWPIDFEPDLAKAAVDVVAFEALDEITIGLLTESESGAFMCRIAEAGGDTTTSSFEKIEDAIEACAIPEEEVTEGSGDGNGDGGGDGDGSGA